MAMSAELHSVLDDTWSSLAAATRTRTPFTLGYLGTLGIDGVPQVRAVILRRVDAPDAAVYFATRADSPKVAELRREPRAALTFYGDETGVQLRLTGRAEVVTDPVQRSEAWAGFADHNRELYRSPASPGTALVDADATAHRADEAAEFARFAWVRLAVDALDRLDLSEPAPIRHEFTCGAGDWSGSAIVP